MGHRGCFMLYSRGKRANKNAAHEIASARRSMKISSIIAKNCQRIAAIDIRKSLIINFWGRKKGIVE